MSQVHTVSRDGRKERNREIVRFAAQMMKNNIADSIIQAKIVEMGLTTEQASAIVNSLRQVRKQVRRKSGIRNMMAGGLICIVGIILTAVTVSAARSGGVYVVMWGAIAFGALMFFGGLFQYIGK